MAPRQQVWAVFTYALVCYLHRCDSWCSLWRGVCAGRVAQTPSPINCCPSHAAHLISTRSAAAAAATAPMPTHAAAATMAAPTSTSSHRHQSEGGDAASPSPSPSTDAAAVAPAPGCSSGDGHGDKGKDVGATATPSQDSAPAAVKAKEEFRNYEDSARHEKVFAFYSEQHAKMTYSFVQQMEAKYLGLTHFRMGIWSALQFLDTFIDDSDPDTEASQMQHALQTAEAIRAQYPGEEYDWFHLTGLIHDLGKILAIACKEPQWATVGDTFPVGCAFSPANVFPDTFAQNPDAAHPVYASECGVYERHCGLDRVKMSWGHDEYLYQVCVRNGCKLPTHALAMIRYHSFYPWHTHGAYAHLAAPADALALHWVRQFNAHDLYSKSHAKQDVEALRPYYQRIIAKYFPDELRW